MGRKVVVILALTLLLAGCAPLQPANVPTTSNSGEDTNQWYREKVDRLGREVSALRKQMDDQAEQLTAMNKRLAYYNLRSQLDYTNGSHPGRIIVAYFGGDGVTTLQPVEGLVRSNEDPVQAAMNVLIKGAREAELYVGIGPNAKLLSTWVVDGVAYVDFANGENGPLDFRGGSSWASTVTRSIVHTLTALDGIKAVQLLCDGQPADLHGLDWSQPKSREALSSYGKMASLIKYTGPGRP